MINPVNQESPFEIEDLACEVLPGGATEPVIHLPGVAVVIVVIVGTTPAY